MEILEGIETRQSIRAFKPNPINRDVMKKMLEAVSNSPSFSNTQPREVVVVSGRKKDELSRKLLELVRAKATTNPDLPRPKSYLTRLVRLTTKLNSGLAADSELALKDLEL